MQQLREIITQQWYISNNPSFHHIHVGIADGCDGSDRTSYPLMENYTHPFAYRTYLSDFGPRMWRHIYTITTARLLHSSQQLGLCCSRLHNACRCLCYSPAECHFLPLCYCDISDAALSLDMFRLEMLSLIAIQSLLPIHQLRLHLLRHYGILHV